MIEAKPKPCDNIRYIAVVKEQQHYVFRYTSGSEPQVLKAVMGFAKDEELNLGYADMVSVIKKLRDGILMDQED